jgi:ATP-dependent Clp protease protease subunit
MTLTDFTRPPAEIAASRLLAEMHAARVAPAAKAKSDDDDDEEDAEDGTLYIYDQVGGSWFSDGVTAKGVTEALDGMKARGVKSLSVFINSPGGSVFEGVAIYNAIKRFDGKVKVIVDGLAASIASIIAMAGDEIVMGPNALMMLHNPSCIAMGNAVDFRFTADWLDKIAGVMVETYAARSKGSAGVIREQMDAETWLTADEAVKAGFADSVVADDTEEDEEEPEDAAAVLESPLFALYRNAPPSLRATAKAGKRKTNPEPPRAALPGGEPAPKEESNMKLIAVALALAADASEAAIVAAVEALKAEALAAKNQLTSFVGLTGATSPSAALGAVQAWKASHEKLPIITTELAALKDASAKAELESMIKAGKDEGKIPPAMEAWARDLGAKDPAQLKGFLAAATAAPKPAKEPKDKPAEPADGATSTLNAKEIELLTKNGLKASLAELEKIKAQHIAEGTWPFAG